MVASRLREARCWPDDSTAQSCGCDACVSGVALLGVSNVAIGRRKQNAMRSSGKLRHRQLSAGWGGWKQLLLDRRAASGRLERSVKWRPSEASASGCVRMLEGRVDGETAPLDSAEARAYVHEAPSVDSGACVVASRLREARCSA